MNKLLNLALLASLAPLVACTEMPGDPEQDLLSEDSSALAEDDSVHLLAGCTGASPISACISRSGNYAVGDFYLNVSPQDAYYTYQADITRSNLGTVRVGSGRLDHSGHYGAWSVNFATSPWTSGCATTVVRVYKRDGGLHLSHASTPVCY